MGLIPEYNHLIFNDNVSKAKGLYRKIWNITREQGEKLHANIETDIANPGFYNISGNENLTGQSNTRYRK